MTEITTVATRTESEKAPKGIVAFLGPKASFTHQATLQDFPEGSGYGYKSCATIKDIVTAVVAGEADYGVVPFENSTYGPVVDTLDLLAASPSAYADLVVIAESYIDVHHALVGRLPPGGASDAEAGSHSDDMASTTSTTTAISSSSSLRPEPSNVSQSSSGASVSGGAGAGGGAYFSIARTPSTSGAATPTPHEPRPTPPRSKPRVSLAHIKTVLSHPQGFGQCAAFLAAYLRHAERHETSSTAAAAERVAKYAGIDEAAIASIAAGRARGLDVLAEQIEDLEGNRTRFLTLSLRKDEKKDAGRERIEVANAVVGSSNAETEKEKDADKKKTLISFRLRPGAPAGALASALAAFTDQGLDLTSIHPRPSGVRAWDYVFVVECVGGHHPSDRAVDAAMRVLAERVERCFLHGRYRDRGKES